MKSKIYSRPNIMLVSFLVFCAAIMPAQAVQSDVLESPTVNFAFLTSDDEPLTVEFTDESTGEPTAWNWDFGDGETSDQQSTTHTYSGAGSYTVTLTVSNENGETDTKVKIISIVIIESRTNKESTHITTIDSPPQKEIINATYVNATTNSNNNGDNSHKYISTNNNIHKYFNDNSKISNSNESNINSKNNNSGNNINKDSNNNNSDNSNHGPSSLFYIASIITAVSTAAVTYKKK